MPDTSSTADALASISHQSKTLGADLALMLLNSTFTPEEKEAWARIIPYMTADELEKFLGILRKNLEGQVADSMEDTILLAKAAQIKHDFALTHAEHEAMEALDDIESELKQLEAKGA